MKHSVPVKFLAILLCALTLLTTLGSAAGILFLAEMDLYNLTVDQVKEQRFHNMGESFAQNIAVDYANNNLGGNPPELVNSVTINPFVHWFNNVFDANHFGYRLLDENGQVLDQLNPEFAQDKKAASYTFPVVGEYMRLLSTTPRDQRTPTSSDLPVVQNNVPEDGRSIFRMVVQYEDGTEFDLRAGAVNGERTSIAYAYYTPYDGQLVIDPDMRYSEIKEDLPIIYIAAWDADDNLMYEAIGNSGVGSFTMSNGHFVFLPTLSPQGSTQPYVRNNIPEEGADIYELFFQYETGEPYTFTASDSPVAYAYYDSVGNPVIQLLFEIGPFYPDIPLTRLQAQDIHGNILYEASYGEGIGYFSPNPDGTCHFVPAIAPAPNGETTVSIDDINPDGHGIYGYNIIYTNGQGHDMYSKKMIGTGYRPTDDELVINLNFRAEEPYLDTPVQTLILYGMDDEVIYHAMNPGVLGWFSEMENGYGFSFAPTATDIPSEEPYLYDAIPPEGCEVYSLNYSTGDSSAGVSAIDPIGFLYYGDGGRVMFRSYDPGLVEIEISGEALTSISFLDENNQPIYEATDPDGVGFFNQDGTNKDVFLAKQSTAPRANGDILDAQGNVLLTRTATADIWTAYFLDANRNVLYQAASFDVPLGSFFYDEEGYAHLSIDLSQPQNLTAAGNLSQNHQICGVTLYGLDGQTLYEGFDADGLGYLSTMTRDGIITFRSHNPDPAPIAAPAEASVSYDGIAPMEQVAEEAENTTPETISETTPEEAAPTMEATVPATTPVEEPSVPATTLPEETSVPTVEATEASASPTFPDGTTAEEATIAPTEPVMLASSRSSNSTHEYYDSETQQWIVAEVTYEPIPAWTVEIFLLPGAYTHEAIYELLEILQVFRYQLFFLLALSGLLLATLTVYLCCAAGKKPGSTETKAAGLNLLPLDLYTCLAIGAICAIAVLGVEGANHLLDQKMEVGFIFAICMAYLGCLVAVGFFYGFVAQLKTPRRFWLKNTLCARFVRLVIRFAKRLETWLSRKGFPFLGRLVKKLWHFSKKAALWTYRTCEKAITWSMHRIGKIFHWFTKKLRRFLKLLPLTWQWLLAGFMVIFVLLICIDGFKDGSDVALPIGLAITIGTVVYASHCFGILSESAKRMGKGDLDTKVEDKLLVGCFEDFAQDLNALADVAVVAAQKQLKSERMKTELITNVSHDIKTPLTSIINYVDLLQKPHTPEQQEQYLEVLDRQSQRLKKLIDDLMDMSKASTGNMSVDITRLDAIESVNQALGEFADKLDRAQLIPVFRHTEDSAPILADGRLVWRVLSNLLSNAVKYAMPGTRLYIDLMSVEGKVILSIKNISREELNLDAEELMERFVRGDDSRNTEGSGLGLNIAKSLMELQKGQLQLLVDGDLFKVTLIFPSV